MAITAAAFDADLFHHLHRRTSTELHVHAVVARRNRAFHHQHVFAGVIIHRLTQRGFGLRARSRHQRLVIIERDDVENQVRGIGSRCPQQRFRAAGAVLKVQPDDGGAARLADLRGNLRH